MIQPEYLSIDDLSTYAGLHKNTLRKYLKGGMPHFRVGTRVCVKRSEFDVWMERFRANGTEKKLKDKTNEFFKELEA